MPPSGNLVWRRVAGGLAVVAMGQDGRDCMMMTDGVNGVGGEGRRNEASMAEAWHAMPLMIYE